MTEFDDLARCDLDAIEAYVVPAPHPDQLGEPLPPEWFAARLGEMRAALVEPYRLPVIDHWTRDGVVVTRDVVIVAADDALLAFDPDPAGDFVLVWRRPGYHTVSHIRGDAVGCFLSI